MSQLNFRAKELIKMNRLSLCLALSLTMGIIVTVSASYGWEIGQNRIRNSDFEGDEVEQPPKEWALEKGG